MRDYVSVYKMGNRFYQNQRTEKNEPIKWQGLYPYNATDNQKKSPAGYNPKATDFNAYSAFSNPADWDPLTEEDPNVDDLKARATRRKLNTISRCVNNAPRNLSWYKTQPEGNYVKGKRSFVYTRLLDPKMYRKSKPFKVS